MLLVQPHVPGPDVWLSMTRYAGGLVEALAGGPRVTVTEASHLNPRGPVRRLFGRYHGFAPLPPRWPQPIDLVHFTDVYLCTHQDRFPATRVATVHDLIPLEVGAGSRYAGHAFRRSLRRVRTLDGVITPSEATRSRLLAATDCDPARVRVTPVLVPDAFLPPAAESGRRRSTILSVGAGQPYKNLAVLIHAMALPQLRNATLIRAGAPFEPELARLGRRLGVSDRIEHRGSVSDDELVGLMGECTVLAQPSLTEGFGIPVAEAMACGLPVVVSDGGALPEVAGAAGRIVALERHSPGKTNLDDARRFGLALAEVLADPALQQYMSEQGEREAWRFRLPAVRDALLAAYAAAGEVRVKR